MELKNYQEDVVLGLIDILLEDEPEYLHDHSFKYDVAAYTLNRIPPKYFMSERGFTRFADLYLTDEADSDGFANLVELSVVVNHAIDTVKQRRADHANEAEVSAAEEIPVLRYVHNFPHIIGRAIDAHTHAPIDGAVVTLYHGGDQVVPASSGWPNPYRTTQQGKGYFSFWPRHAVDGEEELSHRFTLHIRRDGYRDFETGIAVSTRGEYELQETIRNESILNLAGCLIHPTDSR